MAGPAEARKTGRDPMESERPQNHIERNSVLFPSYPERRTTAERRRVFFVKNAAHFFFFFFPFKATPAVYGAFCRTTRMSEETVLCRKVNYSGS